VIISLILAAILSLSFEAPAINLEKCLLGRGKVCYMHEIAIYVWGGGVGGGVCDYPASSYHGD
jgi:hypothetical protein